ncbi:MAG: Rieske 2Fe-2S domain-containing protein [Acidimicrobiales bacterium]|nr:Rieske 2Fe-2S domain-containing protein [Acidimicrobiales bacterium]
MSTTADDPGSGIRPGMENADFEVGPMRPDPDSVMDSSRRVRIRREGVGQKRFPFPIPNGWFVVEESKELAPGEHKNLYAFGKDLVLFRAESGEARLMDAYCPHLGAHMGAGGKVDGDGLRCPFHGWRFDGDGTCTDIPYAEGKAIPAKAKVRTYPIIERNRMIWAWHHLEEGDPFYDVPDWPEFEDPDWQDYQTLKFDVATIVQEFSEGEFDVQHFKYVHGAPPLPGTDLEVDGTYRRNSNGNFTIENFGLGCTRISIGDAVRIGQSLLPIDEENVSMTWFFTMPETLGDGALKMLVDSFADGISQDIVIWENKRYEPKPLVTAVERNIRTGREWSLQFYSGLEA